MLLLTLFNAPICNIVSNIVAIALETNIQLPLLVWSLPFLKHNWISTLNLASATSWLMLTV